jgi:hypothetical protein
MKPDEGGSGCMTDDQRDRIFMLTLVAKASPDKPGSEDPIRAIRWLLKVALRRFQLRCTNMREV